MDGGVEDAGAVEMRREAAAPRKRERLLEVGTRDRPAADGVLERKQARAREVRIVRADRRLDFGQVERAVGAVGEHARVDRAEHAHAARLVAVAVLLRANDHLVAALAVRHERSEIRLRARGEEERRLEAEERRGVLLQAVHRRVVAEDIVAERRLDHGAAHAGGGPGDGVGTKVDHVVHAAVLWVVCPSSGEPPCLHYA